MEYIDKIEAFALVYWPHIVAGITVAWAGFKVIAKYTKTKADDEFVDCIESAKGKKKR